MAGNSFVRKFFILQWKNLLLKGRHWVQTTCEILIPTLLFMGIVAIRVTGGDDITPKPRPAVVNESIPFHFTYCASLAKHTFNGTVSNRTLTYTNSPLDWPEPVYEESQLVQDIMARVNATVQNALWPICQELADLVNITDEEHVVRFRESEQIVLTENERYQANREAYNGELYGGVVFPGDFDYLEPSSEGLPKVPDLDYKIRFGPEFSNKETKANFPIFQFSGPGLSGSLYEEIVKFQNLIDLAYIEIATGIPLLPLVPADVLALDFVPSEEIMPYPAYLENNLAIFLGYMLPMFTVLSFCFILPPLMKRIVHEKQTGVKELMKLMGLPSWMHWTSWFVNGLITSLVTILIIVVLVCVEWKPETGRVFDYSDPVLIYIFFLMYAMALIMSLFAISTFFDSPNLALATGVIFHIITYIIPSILIDDEDYMIMPFGGKLAWSILPNVGLWWGIKILSIEEGKGTGLRSEPTDPMSMGIVWAALLVDMIIYGLIIWYVDSVLPGKYGVARKWYFPFQPSYWCSGMQAADMDPTTLDEDEEHSRGPYFEREQEGQAGIRVKKLEKTFTTLTGGVSILEITHPIYPQLMVFIPGASFKAVNGVSFSAFPGQITALLGHNGAGKTTTMSVLTGMYSATKGAAVIHGYDIGHQMHLARKHLGLCPQHNMLFTDLDVWEHFLFFGMLKGLSRSEARNESLKYLRMLGLQAKTKALVTNLSGGMKRKVNLGIALIGGSKVVMLDEPTSGMDPEARRGIWDLLQEEKKHRTILLTTHFMEEADVLGDRIVIMSSGQVKCSGSPMFLKKEFGHGYTLTMSRGRSNDVGNTLELIRRFVPEADIKGHATGELIVQLPDDQSSQFAELFASLDQYKERLDISNFGLAVTTMEDVFLRVGKMLEYDSDDEEEANSPLKDALRNQDTHVIDGGTGSQENLVEIPSRLRGCTLWWRQLKGLLKKRMLVPAFYALICQLVINETKLPVDTFDARQFDLGAYSEPITFVSSQSAEGGIRDDIQGLESVFKSIVGSKSLQIVEGRNLTKTILEMGQDNIGEYREQYIMGADVQLVNPSCQEPDCRIRLTSIFNSVPNHARPLAKNLLSNTLLRYLEGFSNLSQHSITTSTHPLPENQKVSSLVVGLEPISIGFLFQWRFELISSDFISPYVFAYGMALPQGLGVLISAFVIFPIIERVTSVKQVQLMTGLHPATFWLSHLIWDFVLYILAVLIMMAILLPLDKEQTFLGGEASGAMVLLVALFGLASVPMSYVFSFTCETAASGFALLIILNILSGAIGPTGVWILRFFGDYNGTSGLIIASDVIRYIFTLFPAFPLARSIMALVQIQESNNLCETGIQRDTLEAWCSLFRVKPETLLSEANRKYAQCCQTPYVNETMVVCGRNFTLGTLPIQAPDCHTTESMYTWNALTGINVDLIILGANLVFYFGLLVAVETGAWRRVTKLLQKLIQSCSERRKEALQRAGGQEIDPDVADEKDRVEEELHPTILTNHNEVDALQVSNLQKSFGKFVAVDELSFGVHKGECFGLLGINGAGKTTTFRMLTGDEEVDSGRAFLGGQSLLSNRRQFLRQIGYCPQFDSIIDVLTGGGNKRKLNVALALMGSPSVLFLDEPTTGVDPVARRRLWDVIEAIRKRGQSIVLTSHSMEECEALCQRLAIMVNGQFQCLGTSSHLKSKYAQGFTILLKLNTRDIEGSSGEVMARAKDFVMSSLLLVSIKDEHKDYVHFHVSHTETKWEQLFQTMEDLKALLGESVVEDYSVSQTTLEQVFLSFAKQQISEEDAVGDEAVPPQGTPPWGARLSSDHDD
eukprot:maker-scaffold111_size354240-snap-gene-2.29 protein:Tk11912 transcript:maker-scaffold111_size354240-snap-gene-2.29-mRNA-1 annotation:"atp-binding cassette sub-family a member 3"